MTTFLADIGGTNARFALTEGAGPGPVASDRLDPYPDAPTALASWLAAMRPAYPTQAILAVAGPVRDGRVRLTNRGWLFDAAALAPALGLERVTIVNDFAALAAALPHLAPADLHPLGGDAPEPGAPMLVLGPGTGLGVAALLPPDRVVPTEAGHVTMAAHDAREAAVLAALRARFGHVSAERCLSGPGLANLHAALAAADGIAAPALDPAAIVAQGTAGTDPRATEALAMFCAMLGGFAGDQALSHGATGGVFLAGGILPRIAGPLVASAFRARFEAKGRFASWLAPIPTALILRPHPALLGLAAMAAA